MAMLISVRENLIMRSKSKTDASTVYKVIDNNRAYLRTWLPWVDGTDSPAVTENVITSWEKEYENKGDIVLGIFENGKYIGNIGLHDLKRNNNSGIIGYWLAEACQGRGIMTDCVRTLMNFAFYTLGLNRISIYCAADNKKSRAIPERLGFIQEGLLQDGEYLYGIYHDMFIYGIVKRNWQKSEVFCLIFPTLEHRQTALEYRQEWLDREPGNRISGSWGFQNQRYENYELWLSEIEMLNIGQEPT